MSDRSAESRSEGFALEERLAAARLLALDVDGTLTSGAIHVAATGEIGVFDVHDGLGLVWLRQAGVRLAWITGRVSPAVALRAEKLGIDVLHQGVESKAEILRAVQTELGIDPAATVAMGDDLPDLGLRAAAGTFVAPANARPEVRRVADIVTVASGGRGAVRELCERLLQARGLWDGIVAAALR